MVEDQEEPPDIDCQTEGANGFQFSLTMEVLPSNNLRINSICQGLSIKSENRYRFQLLEARMYGGRNGFKQVVASKVCHFDLQIDNANIEQLPH